MKGKCIERRTDQDKAVYEGINETGRTAEHVLGKELKGASD